MKKIIILISLILLLVINISAYSKSSVNDFYQQNNKQPAKSGNIQSTENKNPSRPHVSSNIQGISNAQNQERQNAGEDKHKWYDKLLDFTLTDFLMVIFSALLTFFSYRLWLTNRDLWKTSEGQRIAMNNQVEELKKSIDISERATCATEKAADAAKASADDLPKAERAYLSVSISADMENWKNAKADQLSPIEIEVCNHGRTPAKVTEIITTIQIGKSDGIVISHGTPDTDYILEAAGRFIGTEIYSRQQFERPVYILSLVDEWNGLGEGNYFISFSGEVRY
jgi:hypothetical protein